MHSWDKNPSPIVLGSDSLQHSCKKSQFPNKLKRTVPFSSSSVPFISDIIFYKYYIYHGQLLIWHSKELEKAEKQEENTLKKSISL